MNRVIKFRAWDKNKNLFIPSDTWAVCQRDNNPAALAIMIKNWEDYQEGEYMYSYEQTIQQFTGLTDKNGKDIYEGDILKNAEHGHSFKITWGIENETYAGWAGVWINSDNGFISPLYNSPLVNCEVIGNIYENPELLTNQS